jgi:DNA-binding MarR family transcriptional regulator
MPAQRHAESEVCSEIAALLHDQFSRLTRQLRNMDLPQGMTPERLSALAVIDKRGPISVTALADK